MQYNNNIAIQKTKTKLSNIMYDDYRIVTKYKIMTKKSQYIIMKNIHTLMQYNKNYHIRNS